MTYSLIIYLMGSPWLDTKWLLWAPCNSKIQQQVDRLCLSQPFMQEVEESIDTSAACFHKLRPCWLKGDMCIGIHLQKVKNWPCALLLLLTLLTTMLQQLLCSSWPRRAVSGEMHSIVYWIRMYQYHKVLSCVCVFTVTSLCRCLGLSVSDQRGHVRKAKEATETLYQGGLTS